MKVLKACRFCIGENVEPIMGGVRCLDCRAWAPIEIWNSAWPTAEDHRQGGNLESPPYRLTIENQDNVVQFKTTGTQWQASRLETGWLVSIGDQILKDTDDDDETDDVEAHLKSLVDQILESTLGPVIDLGGRRCLDLILPLKISHHTDQAENHAKRIADLLGIRVEVVDRRGLGMRILPRGE